MKEIKVAEVNVKKDVILEDNWFYVKKIYDEIGDLSEIGVNNMFSITLGELLLARLTTDFIRELHKSNHKDNIDELIEFYNDVFNKIIRRDINMERI